MLVITCALAEVALPEFGSPEASPPAISLREHAERLAEAERRGREELGLDVLLVYADREHSANLSFLTGFDPRFEEALLVCHLPPVAPAEDGDAPGASLRYLLLGNECLGMTPDDPERLLNLRPVLYQPFSLMGQDRSRTACGGSMEGVLREICGVRPGMRAGIAGWKHVDHDDSVIESPAYIVDALRSLVTGGSAGDGPTKSRGRVLNAGRIFTDPAVGLRHRNSASQLALFEYASTRTSDAIRRIVHRVRPGVSEIELQREMLADGLPHSCHPMVSAGDKASRGMSDPSANRVERGDRFTTAFGLWGALTCRAGMIAAGPEDLPDPVDAAGDAGDPTTAAAAGAGAITGSPRAMYLRFVRNYFEVVATWYRTVRVGVTAGEVFAAVEAVRDQKCYRLLVNPGHLIHLDEWTHSPFRLGDTTVLQSGMALQMDIIPVPLGPDGTTNGAPRICSNCEDGIALADSRLRQEIADRHPEMWSRIEARRAFMRDTLGIEIDASVLPFSNIPAWLPPFLLRPDLALVLKSGTSE